MVTDILSSADADRARAFIEATGAPFEAGFDDLVGVFEGGALVAVGARDRDVLKMIAVDPAEQGGALLGAVVSELARRGYAAGHDGLFVFTRPAAVQSFEALDFTLLASDGRAALLEHGGGLPRWLAATAAGVREGIERRGRRELQPVHARPPSPRRAGGARGRHALRLRRARGPLGVPVRRPACGSCARGRVDLPNVVVLDTSRYAVSAVTFPSYFLKRAADAAAIQVELDLAPLRAAASRRPSTCAGASSGPSPPARRRARTTTAMRRVLPRFGIEAVEVARVEQGGAAMSASRVRGGAPRRATSSPRSSLVPETTAAFLRTEEGRAVGERLRRTEGRHA